MAQLEGLGSLRLKWLPQRHAARATRGGVVGAREGREGLGWGRAPRVLRVCLFFGFFFLHAERHFTRAKKHAVSRKKQAWVENVV
jgi:hypothetical protein